MLYIYTLKVDNPFDVLLEKEKKGEQVSPACCAPGKC